MTPIRLAVPVLLLGCVQPNAHGARARSLTDASPRPFDSAAAAPAPEPPASRPPPPPADVGAVPPADAGAPPPADAGAPPPAEEPCEPGARSCNPAGDGTRVCTGARQWAFDSTCVGGSACSAGSCLCAGPLCHDGVLVRTSGAILQIVAGGRYLHYRRWVPDLDVAGIHRVELGSFQATPVVPDGPGQGAAALASDAEGALYWCRLDRPGGPEAALMRGPQQLEGVACFDLRVTSTHIYWQVVDRPGLHRRALDASGVRSFWTRELEGYALDDEYLYVAALDQGLAPERMIVRRARLDDPGQVQILASSPQPRAGAYHTMLVDDTHLYAGDGERVLRVPLRDGGGTMETFWPGDGGKVMALARAGAHLYWVTAIPGASCLQTAVWRQPRRRDEPPTMLASWAGLCSGTDLPLLGEYLYLALFSEETGSQIVRLRR